MFDRREAVAKFFLSNAAHKLSNRAGVIGTKPIRDPVDQACLESWL